MKYELLLERLKKVFIERAKKEGLPEGIASIEEFEKNLELLNKETLELYEKGDAMEAMEWVIKHNRSPLHQAAFFGQTNSINLMLAEKKYTNININAEDDLGMTPLDYAESQGHTEASELLKQHGGKKAEQLWEFLGGFKYK